MNYSHISQQMMSISPAHPTVKQKKTQLDDKLKHGRHKMDVRSLLHTSLNNINKVRRTVPETDHNTKKDFALTIFQGIQTTIELGVPFFKDKITPVTQITTDELDIQSTKKSQFLNVVSAEGVDFSNIEFEGFDEHLATGMLLNGQDIIDIINVYAQVDEQISTLMSLAMQQEETISKTKGSNNEKEDILPEDVQCNDYIASMIEEDTEGFGHANLKVMLT